MRVSRRLVAGAAAALVAVAVTAYAGWEVFSARFRPFSGIEASVVREPVIAGQQGLLLGNTADGIRRGGRPLVMFLHGAGVDHRAPVSQRADAFTQAMVDRGYLVAASDAHGTVWGTEHSQRDYRRLYRWVDERYDVGPVVLLSQSMGGIPGLHLLADDAIPHVVGWVGVSPVTDLVWAARDGRLGDSVAAALGRDDVRRLDPMRIPAHRFTGEKMVIYAAPDDDVVPAVHARRFVAHLRPAARVRLRGCTGGHNTPGCYDADAVARMFDRVS
jgi:Serine aminopeptidase, S33